MCQSNVKAVISLENSINKICTAFRNHSHFLCHNRPISFFFFILLWKTHRVIIMEQRSCSLILYHCVLSATIYVEQFLNFSHDDIDVRAQSRAIFAVVSFTVTGDKSPL